MDKVVRKWSDTANWPNGILPAAGEDVEILCPWTMLLDIAETPVFKSLTIKGILKFDPTIATTKLKSQSIFIVNGKLIAGSEKTPFPKNIEIHLVGEMNDPMMLVDAYIDAGNKQLVTTGELSLFGKKPIIIMTKLSAYADKGATSISVTNAVDWKVGEEVVITSSGSSYYE